jgi:Fe-S cluster assembly protein SufD
MSAVTTSKSFSDIISSFQTAKFGEGNESRKKAIDTLTRKGLPGTKHEEYRFTPLTRAIDNIFTWKNEVTPAQLTSIDQFLIPELEANIVVFINGQYSTTFSKLTSPANEIKIKPLYEAFKSEKELVAEYFDTLVSTEADSFAAMNTALWQDGFFIHVPADTTVQKPVLILHINDASQEQVIAHTRLLVIMESGSKLSIIEKFNTVGEHAALHTFTEEIVVKEKAALEYCKIQNDSGKTYQIANSNIHQSDSSRVDTFTLLLNGQIIRNNFTITIAGESCESHFNGLYMLHGNTVADNHTVVDHQKPNSFSNEMYKGVLDGNSKGVFNGKIFVRPNAQKTNAFQSNRNICLSPSAAINTKPQLEIWADDVKCSHGCTIGQLDEEAVFYLQSRGIDKETAQGMMLYAFTAETLKTIANETLKTYVDSLISERLHKNF